jgi:hypothetical protein
MLAWLCLVAAVAAAAATPNVLLILVDDLGFADVSFNARVTGAAAPVISTPNIDKLATAGQVGLARLSTPPPLFHRLPRLMRARAPAHPCRHCCALISII